MFLVLLVLTYSTTAVNSEYSPDIIHSLPGWTDSILFSQHSGYLRVGTDKFLHYWFVESQRSPSEDPVILWLNGGPGCSSLYGYISELGPFHLEPDGKTLYENEFSWNKVANIIFLESPVGVGFSYTLSQNYTSSDDTVAEDNYAALEIFFEKFPEFQGNDFYIAGESYAGIYIPTLSEKVLKKNLGLHFKGIAIGNGLFDKKFTKNSLVFYAYYHGLIGDQLWRRLNKQCCESFASPSTCDFTKGPNKECNHEMVSVNAILRDHKLNKYNMLENCDRSQGENTMYNVETLFLFRMLPMESNTSDSPEISYGSACVDNSNGTNYFNQKLVRRALHIPEQVQNWTECSKTVSKVYSKTYDNMKPQFSHLIEATDLRILLYNGDLDMVCNFLGSVWFTGSLNLTRVDGSGIWKSGGQVLGFATNYKHLTYLTVKGAGHMVPKDNPYAALEMIKTFIHNEPF